MSIPCQTYFLPPLQTAGPKALKDITDAIGFWVTPVDSWRAETVTPLPDCDASDALIWSVEDVLQELAQERCYQSLVVGWDARTTNELPIDLPYIDARFQTRVKELGGSAKPDGLPLAEWLRRGQSKQPGHRPFVSRRFKDQIVHLIGQDAAREMLSLLCHHVLRDPLAAFVAKQSDPDQAGIRRANLLEELLPTFIKEYISERGLPPSRRDVKQIFMKAWSEVLRSLP